MGLCCKILISVVMLAVSALVMLAVPVLTMKYEKVNLDDMPKWGFDGPSKDAMPELLKGTFRRGSRVILHVPVVSFRI